MLPRTYVKKGLTRFETEVCLCVNDWNPYMTSAVKPNKIESIKKLLNNFFPQKTLFPERLTSRFTPASSYGFQSHDPVGAFLLFT